MMESKDPSNPQQSTRDALFDKLADAARRTAEYIALQRELVAELEKLATYQVYDLVEVRTKSGKKSLKIYGISVRNNAYFYKVYLQETNRNKATYIPESDIVRAGKPREPKAPKK